MLGHRGCRLCITYPEILDMQVTAIIQAAINVAKKGIKVFPEIMIPLTIDKKELQIQVDQARALADGLIKAAKATKKTGLGSKGQFPGEKNHRHGCHGRSEYAANTDEESDLRHGYYPCPSVFIQAYPPGG